MTQPAARLKSQTHMFAGMARRLLWTLVVVALAGVMILDAIRLLGSTQPLVLVSALVLAHLAFILLASRASTSRGLLKGLVVAYGVSAATTSYFGIGPSWALTAMRISSATSSVLIGAMALVLRGGRLNWRHFMLAVGACAVCAALLAAAGGDQLRASPRAYGGHVLVREPSWADAITWFDLLIAFFGLALFAGALDAVLGRMRLGLTLLLYWYAGAQLLFAGALAPGGSRGLGYVLQAIYIPGKLAFLYGCVLALSISSLPLVPATEPAAPSSTQMNRTNRKERKSAQASRLRAQVQFTGLFGLLYLMWGEGPWWRLFVAATLFALLSALLVLVSSAPALLELVRSIRVGR